MGGIRQRDGSGPIGLRGLRLAPVGLGGFGLGAGLPAGGLRLAGERLRVPRRGGGGVGRGPHRARAAATARTAAAPETRFMERFMENPPNLATV